MEEDPTSLEALVSARTAQLHEANAALQKEIDRRTEMERELRGSWEYFRLIVEAAPVGVIMLDQDERITLANDHACAIFGYTLEDLVGQRMVVLVPELLRAKEAPVPVAGRGRELAGRRKDGREIAVEIELTHLRANAGIFALASIVDVTERRENQQNLQRLAAIVQSSDDAIISATVGGVLTSWNPGATRLFGYSAEEMVGKPMALLFPPERVTVEIDLLSSVREGKIVDHFETLRRRKDGLLIDVSVTISPMRDSAGNVVGAATIARDITDRKQAMNALKELNEALEQRVDERTAQLSKSLREKEALLREIHHRVKNNMQIISSILRLQSQYIRDPDLRAVFQDCQGRIRTMALIHEMLYQSEGLARVDFKTYLQNLAGLLLRAQSNKSLALRHQFDIAPAHLTMDLAIPVGLIANELLTNCLKHAFASREKGLVRVALKVHADRRIELTIGDDGCGLPADFAPGKSASLGLRLVKILTDQIKGSMEWHNANGAEFVLTFRDPTDISSAAVSHPAS
jgi:PAS domain S-box-containing protein